MQNDESKTKRGGWGRGAMEGDGLQFLQTGRESIEEQNWGGGVKNKGLGELPC